jgi:hypothetical protein
MTLLVLLLASITFTVLDIIIMVILPCIYSIISVIIAVIILAVCILFLFKNRVITIN